VTEHIGWVATRAGAVFTGLHAPDGPARGNAVLLVPPFGWEGVSAGRNLRAWARDLAAVGHPTLRYHPPGAGDSAGEGAAQDLHSWSAALADLVSKLRTASGGDTVTVIGLGLGGLVALQAVSEGADVDDLVVWATPGRGRLLLRELRAFAAMAAEPGEQSSEAPQPLEAITDEDGVLWVHGYPLSVAAQEQLQALDATSLDLSRLRRALLLGRGTLPADRKLADALAAAGADVTTSPGPAPQGPKTPNPTSTPPPPPRGGHNPT
jgi:pimeloyl-ACP methyl ester carboxylesterase